MGQTLLNKASAQLLLVLLALICFSPSIHRLTGLKPHERQNDFEVYYTAGSLVLHHQGDRMYSEADTDLDPQLRYADPSGFFARTAGALGIPEVRLYVYPPTLADLVAPLAALPIAAATTTWKLLTILALASAGLLLATILRLPFWSFWTAAIVAFLVLFGPSMDCLNWGQITSLLTFLVVAGLALYARGYKTAAMLFFAFATAIKVTPGIIVIPLLVWRDWKSLRLFTLWCSAFLAVLWGVHGTALLADYVHHVLPAMSHGIVKVGNRNLNSTFFVTWHALGQSTSPAWLALLSKLSGPCALAAAAWLSRPAPAGPLYRDNSLERVTALSVFLLLACSISPVSWWHAYVLGIPALVLILSRALDGRLRKIEAFFLTCFILALSQGTPSSTARITLTLLTPIFGLIVSLLTLQGFRRTTATAPQQEAHAAPPAVISAA